MIIIISIGTRWITTIRLEERTAQTTMINSNRLSCRPKSYSKSEDEDSKYKNVSKLFAF